MAWPEPLDGLAGIPTVISWKSRPSPGNEPEGWLFWPHADNFLTLIDRVGRISGATTGNPTRFEWSLLIAGRWAGAGAGRFAGWSGTASCWATTWS